MKATVNFRLISITLISVLLLIIQACTSNNNGSDDPGPQLPDLRAITETETRILDASNEFSLDIFSRINAMHPDDNVFISPFSISTALSMTLNGASGQTLSDMKTALGLTNLSNQEINDAYKTLVTFLLELDPKVNLQVANSNWYKDTYSINPDFKDILLDYYSAEVLGANFADPATLDLINGWIEDSTNGKIKDMLDVIPASAVMYLINAKYFKADWTYQFDKSETRDRDFYFEDGSQGQVPTMYSEGVLMGINYGEDTQLIDIPYGNGQFSFTVLMPTDPQTDINTFMSEISTQKVTQLLGDTLGYSMELYMPKFKIEFKQLLNDVLVDMGMGIAFSGGADFSNLFQEELNLMISRVLHQSFLEVNEEGSEAAAATIVEIIETSVGPPKAVHLNRPFIFMIREKHSNTILFAGKLLNPDS